MSNINLDIVAQTTYLLYFLYLTRMMELLWISLYIDKLEVLQKNVFWGPYCRPGPLTHSIPPISNCHFSEFLILQKKRKCWIPKLEVTGPYIFLGCLLRSVKRRTGQLSHKLFKNNALVRWTTENFLYFSWFQLVSEFNSLFEQKQTVYTFVELTVCFSGLNTIRFVLVFTVSFSKQLVVNFSVRPWHENMFLNTTHRPHTDNSCRCPGGWTLDVFRLLTNKKMFFDFFQSKDLRRTGVVDPIGWKIAVLLVRLKKTWKMVPTQTVVAGPFDRPVRAGSDLTRRRARLWGHCSEFFCVFLFPPRASLCSGLLWWSLTVTTSAVCNRTKLVNGKLLEELDFLELELSTMSCPQNERFSCCFWGGDEFGPVVSGFYRAWLRVYRSKTSFATLIMWILRSFLLNFVRSASRVSELNRNRFSIVEQRRQSDFLPHESVVFEKFVAESCGWVGPFYTC